MHVKKVNKTRTQWSKKSKHTAVYLQFRVTEIQAFSV